MTINLARHLGTFILAAIACRQASATLITLSNFGGASNTTSYTNSYDSNAGYAASGNGGYTTTSTGTVPGLYANQISGSATDPVGNFGRNSFVDSTVSVSLATGEIKVYEEAGNCYATGTPACGGLVNASGRINENVTFHNSTGAPVSIGFTWRATLNASIQAVPIQNGAIYSSVGGTTSFSILSGQITYDFGNCSSLVSCGAIDGSRTGGFDSFSMTPSGTFGEQFFATSTIAPGDTKTGVIEFFNPVCSGGAVCDGSHTAALTFDLPKGVTFSSDSGVFLTQAAATPEPGTWALMGFGFLCLYAARRYFALPAFGVPSAPTRISDTVPSASSFVIAP